MINLQDDSNLITKGRVKGETGDDGRGVTKGRVKREEKRRG